MLHVGKSAGSGPFSYVRHFSYAILSGKADRSATQRSAFREIQGLLRYATGNGPVSAQIRRIEVIRVPWWGYLLFLMVVAVAIWGFISLVRFRTRMVSSRTHRTAEDLYPAYADSPRKQRRHAREHDGQEHSHQGR